MGMKSLNVISWHYQTPERRALKRNRLGPPDVYPQDVKQEEDNLGADRLKKGYQVAVTSYEHESIVYNVKMPRLDRLDDTMLRGAQLVMQIMAKKMELNANLDKERRRAGSVITKDSTGSGGNGVGGGPQIYFQQFSHNAEKAKKSKERNDWFTDLAHGKPLAVLARKPPFFRKKEDALEYLCDYKVPVNRALWFLKLIAVSGQGCNSNVNKQKKSTTDQLASEFASLFTKYIKLMLNQMSDSAKLESNIVYTDRWPHFVYICKHAYEDGMVEKQEFLMDLLDIFNDRFVQPIENRKNDKTLIHPFLHHGSGFASASSTNQSHYVTLLRLFLLFICQYTDQITQNIVLSKRCAFLVCHRLELYRDEAEEREGRSVDCVELFDDMQQCIHQRAIILTLCGMLYAILIDCPAALIWNKYEVSPGRPPTMLHQLCGSPLDHLPCPFESLPLPPGHGTERLQEFIQLRLAEVRRRSRACENKWSLNYAQKKGFAALVLQCLEIVGVLDAARLDQPNCVEKIYAVIFNGPSKESFEHEHAIRVKMLLQWAVTVEREGTHRAILVAQLLAFRINHRKTFKFGSLTLQEILLEFLVTEGPDPENTDKNRFSQEFANLMLLFIELQRAGVFSHDLYMKELIRTGEMLEYIPLMQKIRKRKEDKQKQHQQLSNTVAFPSTFVSQPNETTAALLTGAVTTPPPLVTMPSELPDEHPFLFKDLSVHERLLIHLPIPQSAEYRSECNQRSLLLYGIGAERDAVKLELRRLARELAKLWQKRIVVEFSFNKPLEIRFKKRTTREQLQESMAKFRSCTYYDQLVLCGWCCESFIQMVQDFVDGHSCLLPTAEGLDIILEMCELAQNIAGIMELAEELLPLLVLIERVLLERRVDCVPSNLSAQLGYVLTAYISHNYYYFLYSQNAPNIVQGLYRVIESQLKSSDFCLTGWGRTIAVFVLDAKKQLIETGLCSRKIEAKRELLKRVIPPWKPAHNIGDRNPCGGQRYAYNASTFKELLEEPKRIFSFNEYRRLHAVIDGTDDARYSFVVSALLAVVHGIGNVGGNDNTGIGSGSAAVERLTGDRLVELANICGHVSAQAAQVEKYLDWCGALQALCCSSLQGGTSAFPDLLMEINVEDSTCHYNIATFYMLLAGRSCFSINALVHQLLHTALKSLLNCGIGKVLDADAEAGVCLALLVLANIVCQSDQPIILSPQYTGERISSNICKADRWILTEGHLHDIGDEVCALLVTICMIADYTKHKLRDRYSDDKPIDQRVFRREYIAELSKGVLMAMCEQEWVTQRIYRRCEDGALDCFSSHQLRKNCLGQQLLRMALRRRSEREIVRELTICNGNSKKSLIDKLLNVLNIWNTRATYFDFKLMIREISPEGCTSKHAQQGAIAADALLGEIGKCCRDLFTQSHKSDKKLPPAAVGKAFRLKDITAYWLISPLVHACPRPGNLPASFPAITVQGKFLKEAAAMLDTSSDNNKERIQQSTWLLSQEPFLNLVLTCLNGEEQQRDGLVGSMLKQLQELALKAKDNPLLPYLRIFSLEREGVLLRISLVGGMFDSVCHTSICDTWALTLFQLMLYGVISKERDGYLFDSCYDMLSTLLVWSITDPMNAAAMNTQDPDTKFRFPTYSLIVKKLRKELNERALIPELRSLIQFLPIPKPQFELITCEPYGTLPTSPQKLGKSQSQGQIIQTTVKANRHGLQFAEKVKLSAYDIIQYLNIDSTLLKRPWNWSMLQAVKLDRLPVPVQRYIQRLVHHSHYNEFVRPTICGMDRPPNLDIYLSPPMMDVSETPATLHHVSSSAATSTTTSASSTNVPVSSGGAAMDVGTTLGPVVQGRAMSYQSSSTPTCTSIPDGSTPSSTPGAPSTAATAMIFPGQSGPMPTLPDLTGRGQNNASPRGARGGRRKAAGLSTRSQGTTRKQRQQRQQTVDQLAVAAAAAAAAAQQQQQQMSSAVGCGGGPPQQPTYPSTWATGPQQTGVPQQFASGPSVPPSGTGQAGTAMGTQTTEDSKMKIHSMILQKRQAQAASGATATQQGVTGGPQPSMQDVNAYQISAGPPQYGGNMIMKVETGANSMQMVDHTQQQQQQQQQQQYAQQQQLIQMQQDVQGGSQYVVHQQQRGGIAYGQSVQQATYDSRFSQQQLQYGQQPQQQQQQYHPTQQY